MEGGGCRGQRSSDGPILRGGLRGILVHKMEAVWSVVELGVYRVYSGANKCIRGPLKSIGGEVKHFSRLPHFDKR